MKRGLDAATSGLLAGELFAGGGTMAAEAERLDYTVRVPCEKEPHLQAVVHAVVHGLSLYYNGEQHQRL